MRRYSRKHICEALAYWKGQLRMLDESKEKQLDEGILDAFSIKKLIDKAKEAASKIKTAAQISAFIAEHLDEIYEIGDCLPARSKADLMSIVDSLDSYSKSEEMNESMNEDIQAKIISALIALILFLLNAPRSWIAIAASPVLGPLVAQGVKLASSAIGKLAKKSK